VVVGLLTTCSLSHDKGLIDDLEKVGSIHFP
jgi:hypothetical protein